MHRYLPRPLPPPSPPLPSWAADESAVTQRISGALPTWPTRYSEQQLTDPWDPWHRIRREQSGSLTRSWYRAPPAPRWLETLTLRRGGPGSTAFYGFSAGILVGILGALAWVFTADTGRAEPYEPPTVTMPSTAAAPARGHTAPKLWDTSPPVVSVDNLPPVR